MTPAQRLDDLRARNPEWAPWLAVISVLLEEIALPGWDDAVPDEPKVRGPAQPLLAKTVLRIDADRIDKAYERLVRSARGNATSRLAELAEAQVDARALFQAALNRDDERLHAYASHAGVDPAAFEALARLLPMPFLHACNRRWGESAVRGWNASYCAVCGAWPAFAEVLGIERSRHLRCGQCGSAWEAHGLICVYCGMADHNALASLVPEKGGSAQSIDACKRCLGYLKVFTRLRGSAPVDVTVDDLASAELDIAATVRGYKRPSAAGHALQVSLNEA